MSERLLLERLLKAIRPKPDLSFTPPPSPIAPGIWAIDRRVHVAGARLPSRSTAIDLGAGRLLLISPPADACAELDGVGRMAGIVAPNSFHYLYAESYLHRYPDAELYAAPGLPSRVPTLPSSIELKSELRVSWREDLPYVVLGPHRGVSEVLFFHRASRTLILTDLASNLVGVRSGRDRWAHRLAGMPSGFGPSRNARRLLLRDEALAREALRSVAEWPFERIVVAHGEIVERDARQRFRAAFARYL